MKNLYEHFISYVITIILIFSFICINIASSEVSLARSVHAQAMNYLSASYFELSAEDLNDSLTEFGATNWNWYFTIEDVIDDPTNTTKDLTLHYTVTVPLFNITSEKELSGYVR